MAPRTKFSQHLRESSKRPRPEEETPLDDANTPYSNPRFISLEAQQKYTEGFAKRPVLCESEIKLSDYVEPPYELQSLMTSRGWQTWVDFQYKAIMPLVKEFYSNIIANKDESGQKCIKTLVRKIELQLTPHGIAEMSEFPREMPIRMPEE